jgi:hypothetical protein
MTLRPGCQVRREHIWAVADPEHFYAEALAVLRPSMVEGHTT